MIPHHGSDPTSDFKYLNVPGSLCQYANPTDNRHEITIAIAETELTFFQEYGLLRTHKKPADIGSLVLWYSEFTDEGQAFLLSQAVERWLGSCDRKGTVDAYRDPKGLISRLAKFRAKRAET